jgi:hypothetical protein
MADPSILCTEGRYLAVQRYVVPPMIVIFVIGIPVYYLR